MKNLACRDLGMDCSFVATGKTAEETKKNAFDHGGKAHAEMMAKMSADEMKAFEAKIDTMLK